MGWAAWCRAVSPLFFRVSFTLVTGKVRSALLPYYVGVTGFGIFSLLFSIHTRLLGEPICHHVLMTACWSYQLYISTLDKLSDTVNVLPWCSESVKSLDEEQQASVESWQYWVAPDFGSDWFQDYAIFGDGWDCTVPHRHSLWFRHNLRVETKFTSNQQVAVMARWALDSFVSCTTCACLESLQTEPMRSTWGCPWRASRNFSWYRMQQQGSYNCS